MFPQGKLSESAKINSTGTPDGNPPTIPSWMEWVCTSVKSTKTKNEDTWNTTTSWESVIKGQEATPQA